MHFEYFDILKGGGVPRYCCQMPDGCMTLCGVPRFGWHESQNHPIALMVSEWSLHL